MAENKNKIILALAIVVAFVACIIIIPKVAGTDSKVKGTVSDKGEGQAEEQAEEKATEQPPKLKEGTAVYEIASKKASADEIERTIERIQKRAQYFHPDAKAYQEGSKWIVVEIPDAEDEIYDGLGKVGSMTFFAVNEEDRGESLLFDDEIESAKAVEQPQDDGTQGYAVEVTFVDEAAQTLAEATAQNIGRQILCVYDDEVLCAVTIDQEIEDGVLMVGGMVDQDSAEQLAAWLSIGSLPLQLQRILE